MLRSIWLGLVLWAAPSWAIGVGADIGGGVWLPSVPQFQARLNVRGAVGSPAKDMTISVGGSAGVLLNTPSQLGVPIDLSVRLRVSRVFFDVAGGPWLMFGDSALVRAHAGFTFGVLVISKVTVSLEAGWLQPSPLLLLRVGFSL